MLYYLVGLLDRRSYAKIEEIQRTISNEYDLYDQLPILHLTLEIIENPHDMEFLCNIISKILKGYKDIKIKIDGAICFEAPYKSVNLKVEKDQYLMELIYNINSSLKSNGFKVRENIDDWELHISLANTNFSKRNWTNKEYQEACLRTIDQRLFLESTINKIQLWKPINNINEMVVKTFTL